MSFECLKPHKDGVLLAIQAVPRSSKTEIVDFLKNRCKIKVKAPPVEGAANAQISAVLAKIFDIRKKDVILEQGFKGRQKVFLLKGLTVEKAREILKGKN